jgi:hypothetical protein
VKHGEDRIYRASCIGGEIRFVAAEPDVMCLYWLGDIEPDPDRDHGWILRLGEGVSYLLATQAILSLGPPYLQGIGGRSCGSAS